MDVRITGRSSSHFTRTARVFAEELGIAYEFSAVLNLLSPDDHDYAGNPALRLPVLETEQGAWYGTLNICRELGRRSAQQVPIVWPEHQSDRLTSNAQELVLHGMSTVVGLIMQKLSNPGGSGSYEAKSRTSLLNTLAWLDLHWSAVLDSLPPQRGLSYLEVTAFCFVTHLEFRQVLDISPYSSLKRFSTAFGQRSSARVTSYQFDSA
jgi:glutathione S-transferase